MDETTSEKKDCPCAVIKDAGAKVCQVVTELPVVGSTLSTIRKICDGVTSDKGLRWISLFVVYGTVAYTVWRALDLWFTLWSAVPHVEDAWATINLFLLNLLWPIVFAIAVTHFVRRATAFISQATTSNVPAISIVSGLLKAMAEAIFVTVLWLIPLLLIFAILNPEVIGLLFDETAMLSMKFGRAYGYGDKVGLVISGIVNLVIWALSLLIGVRIICELLDLAVRAVGSLEAIRDSSKE